MKLKRFWIPLLCFVATAVVFVMAGYAGERIIKDSEFTSLDFSRSWNVVNEDGSERTASLPQRLSDREHTIRKVLPVNLSARDYLYIKTNYQGVAATIDGQTVRVSGLIGSGSKRYDCELQWTRIALPQSMAGKTIELTFADNGGKPWVEVYQICCGSGASIRLRLLASSLFQVVISIIQILMALIVLCFSSLETRRFKRKSSPAYRWLLLFVALAAGWFFFDSDIIGAAFVGSAVTLALNIGCFLVMPLPFIIYARMSYPSLKNLMTVLIAALLLNVGTQCVLIAVGGFTLWISVSLSHVYLCVAIVSLLVTSLRMLHKKEGRERGELVFGTCVLTVTGAVTMAMYYWMPIADNSMIFRYGVLVYVVALLINALRSDVDVASAVGNYEALRIREEEYRIAVEHGNKLVLRFDVRSRTIRHLPADVEHYHVEPEIADMPESVIRKGDVAAESAAEYRRFYADIIAGVPKGSAVVRLRVGAEPMRWYHLDYTTIFDEKKQPLQAVVSFYDVTDQREKEMAYRQWQQLYAQLPVESASRYEYNVTRDRLLAEHGKLLPPLPTSVGRTVTAIGEYIASHFAFPADADKFREFFDRAHLLDNYARDVRTEKLDVRRVDELGRPLWTTATVQLVPDPYTGDVQGSLLLQDVDEEKRAQIENDMRSNTDALTGLLNRAAFAEGVGRMIAVSGERRTHAFMMIDVDHFKQVNDTFGHQFGDRVLIDVAADLTAMMRSDDLIGRLGGDEYVVCLKNVPIDSGFLEKRARNICGALQKQLGGGVDISASVGIAVYPKDGNDFDTLYSHADKALYVAKEQGRNCFVFYSPEMENVEESPLRRAADEPTDDVSGVPAELPARRSLLITDDLELNRDMLSELFADEYDVFTASSGEECLDMLQNNPEPISALLLDLVMPGGMDGFDVLTTMQKDAYLSAIPVVVITVSSDSESSLKALALGATDYIVKPFDPAQMRIRVRNAVTKRETEEARARNRYALAQQRSEHRHRNEMRYLTEHDALTNICNKASFYAKTEEMLKADPDGSYVMIAFDVEKFRVLNDIFGHDEGDRLLRYIAANLQRLLHGKGTYARIMADNFAACVPYHSDTLMDGLKECTQLLKEYDLEFEVMLAFGLYVIDDRRAPISLMHDRAEMAKRTVKGNYLKRYAFYDKALRQSLLDELEIANAMNEALEQRRFEIWFQPKCLLDTGEIVGAEALVRWNDPKRGMLSPGVFIPIFERNGSIMKLDAYVWEEVCAQIRHWLDHHAGQTMVPVSMNISRIDLYNPELVQNFITLFKRYNLPASAVELEITESAYANDPQLLTSVISQLRAAGFSIAMDDFGSGYSSLNMLKEIPVDVLKLDMRFLYGDDEHGRGGSVLSSVARMARCLDLPIVAEGVESADQARFLSSIGCTCAQGYYFFRPMPVSQFEALLASHPVKLLPYKAANEESIRRVWRLGGDYDLMLNTAPFAAAIAEQTPDSVELLRVNDEFIQEFGQPDAKDSFSAVEAEDARRLRALTHRQNKSHLPEQGEYMRHFADGSYRRVTFKSTYLGGSDERAQFFLSFKQ